MSGSAMGGGAMMPAVMGAAGGGAAQSRPMTRPSGGKGGGSVGQPTAQAGFAPLTPQGNFNVNQASAGALQQAMMGTQAGMGFQPGQIQAASYRPATGQAQGYQAATGTAATYDPSTMRAQGYNAAQTRARGYGAERIGGAAPIQEQSVQARQIASSDLGAYTNPYETQVVDTVLGDIERSRQMAQNTLGAQATASRAFGGSRQGIAEAETNRAFADKAASAAADLRQAGFTQAQQMAGQDISTQMQADLANQAQNLAAQSQTAGNVLAAQQANQAAQNMASQFGAGAQNAASMQNAAAINAARSFGAGAQNAAASQNMAALNAAGQFGAGAQNAMTSQNLAALNAARSFGAGAQNAMTGMNVGAINAASQFGAGNQMAAQQQNIANQMAANQQRLGAASQMGALGQQAFQTGQTIQQNQQTQGLLQQGLQQALIDAARGQYQGYVGSPSASLSAPLAALGVAGPNAGSTTTQSQQPGLFNYLQLGAQAYASDVRLKENVTEKGKIGNVNFYTWDWSEDGKKVAHPEQPTFGVIAQELQKTHPHLVSRGNDSYLRVNYAGLASELESAV